MQTDLQEALLTQLCRPTTKPRRRHCAALPQPRAVLPRLPAPRAMLSPLGPARCHRAQQRAGSNTPHVHREPSGATSNMKREVKMLIFNTPLSNFTHVVDSQSCVVLPQCLTQSTRQDQAAPSTSQATQKSDFSHLHYSTSTPLTHHSESWPLSAKAARHRRGASLAPRANPAIEPSLLGDDRTRIFNQLQKLEHLIAPVLEQLQQTSLPSKLGDILA